MDYTFDEQQQDVADITATIIGKTVDAEHLAALEAQGESFDTGLWADLAGSGLIGIAVEDDLGGSGAGFTELCVVISEAAKAAAPVHLVETAVLAALPIQECGADELKRRWLPGFASGETILTSALSVVPGQPVAITASRTDDGWALTGTVSHVVLAERAQRVLVRARDIDGRDGLFLVDPQHATVTPQSSVDRRGRSQLAFDETLVPDEDVLLAPGRVDEAVDARVEALGVAALAIRQLGTLESALASTAAYAGERTQFGRAIGTFQAVAHRIAEAYIDVRAVHLTAWRAAWLAGEAVDDPEATALAGFWAADAANRVVETVMQVHGGVSVDLEFPIHRHYLAARQTTLTLGGPNRRLTVLGRLIAGGRS